MAREPWDRLTHEPEDSYRRFLIYRNVGIRRSLRTAYVRYLRESDNFGGPSKSIRHVPPAWSHDARAFFWRDRARSWDIRNLHAYGARVAVLHVQAVTQIAAKVARKSRTVGPGDDGYKDVLDGFRAVAEYLTPDVIRGIKEGAERGGELVPAAAPTGDPDE